MMVIRYLFLITTTSLLTPTFASTFIPQQSTTLRTKIQMTTPSTTTTNIETKQIKLSTNISAQIMLCRHHQQNNQNNKPPLVFLHGSFHASWCWMEHYGPYFTSHHHNVICLSWRGTGGTPAGDGIRKIKIRQHVHDLQSFLEDYVLDELKWLKPILIGHSFGGLTIMKYLQLYPDMVPNLSGIAVLCSVPPSGNGSLTRRYLRNRPWVDSWKITTGFALKRCTTNPKLCRDLFFDVDINEKDLIRYMTYFERDSKATIDLIDLSRGGELPSLDCDEDGVAKFVVSSEEVLPPRLVLGATDDFIVDEIANEESAKFFGLDGGKEEGDVVYVESCHDVMLGPRWRNGAEAIKNWIDKEILG